MITLQAYVNAKLSLNCVVGIMYFYLYGCINTDKTQQIYLRFIKFCGRMDLLSHVQPLLIQMSWFHGSSGVVVVKSLNSQATTIFGTQSISIYGSTYIAWCISFNNQRGNIFTFEFKKHRW